MFNSQAPQGAGGIGSYTLESGLRGVRPAYVQISLIAMFFQEFVMVRWAPVGLGLCEGGSYILLRPGISLPKSLQDNSSH